MCDVWDVADQRAAVDSDSKRMSIGTKQNQWSHDSSKGSNMSLSVNARFT